MERFVAPGFRPEAGTGEGGTGFAGATLVGVEGAGRFAAGAGADAGAGPMFFF